MFPTWYQGFAWAGTGCEWMQSGGNPRRDFQTGGLSSFDTILLYKNPLYLVASDYQRRAAKVKLFARFIEVLGRMATGVHGLQLND
jgi:hypothetical protein